MEIIITKDSAMAKKLKHRLKHRAVYDPVQTRDLGADELVKKSANGIRDYIYRHTNTTMSWGELKKTSIKQLKEEATKLKYKLKG